jgi:hypothetical protein
VPVVDTERACPDCKLTGQTFHLNARRASGHDSICVSCKHRRRLSGKEYTEEWRAAQRARIGRWRRSIRARVIQLYGGICACCGEDEYAFLCIDHVDGNGSRARGCSAHKEMKRALREWPSAEFQVLCANCNMAKERKEGCPHRQSAAAHYAGRFVLGWGL